MLNKKGKEIMAKQKKIIKIMCVETPRMLFRWFHKEEEARVFAINVYSDEDDPLDNEEIIINEAPIYEHPVKLSPKGICKLLNKLEL